MQKNDHSETAVTCQRNGSNFQNLIKKQFIFRENPQNFIYLRLSTTLATVKLFFQANKELILCVLRKDFVCFWDEYPCPGLYPVQQKYFIESSSLNKDNSQKDFVKSLSQYKLIYSTKILGKLHPRAKLTKLVLVKSKTNKLQQLAFTSACPSVVKFECCGQVTRHNCPIKLPYFHTCLRHV